MYKGMYINHNNLFALALVISLDDLVNSHKCSLQGVEAVIVIYDQLLHKLTKRCKLPRGVEHFLLDLSAIRAPTHEEQFGFEG